MSKQKEYGRIEGGKGKGAGKGGKEKIRTIHERCIFCTCVLNTPELMLISPITRGKKRSFF